MANGIFGGDLKYRSDFGGESRGKALLVRWKV